ncbi:MAG: hypothetical protein P8P56_08530 [Yoonia sp.]|nr:hypothetical protein [Yoonia sp.]
MDWLGGFPQILAATGAKHGLDRFRHDLANDMRRKGLGKMVNLGNDAPPAYNFDGAHHMALEEVITEQGLDAFTQEERHNFKCWPEFPPVLAMLRERYICALFTILSFRIIMDTTRRNGLSWDAVFSCAAIGKYKVLPEAYDTVAQFLQFEPS